MHITFEKTPLILGLAGGALITGAVTAMNTLPTGMRMLVGGGSFSAGWLVIMMSFLKNDTRHHKYKKILIGASVGVYSMAMMSRMLMDAGKTGAPLKASKGLFLLFWLAIGVSIGMKKDEANDEENHNPTTHALGLLPPALVVLSMMSINGYERPNNVASGPGMPLFAFSWMALTLVNALICKSPREMSIDMS